ncbi:MAG: hypothetical protein Q3962_04730 [Corynebacterium sp.]|nr:hypothetical protein [Corynebacterium sp.]
MRKTAVMLSAIALCASGLVTLASPARADLSASNAEWSGNTCTTSDLNQELTALQPLFEKVTEARTAFEQNAVDKGYAIVDKDRKLVKGSADVSADKQIYEPVFVSKEYPLSEDMKRETIDKDFLKESIQKYGNIQDIDARAKETQANYDDLSYITGIVSDDYKAKAKELGVSVGALYNVLQDYNNYYVDPHAQNREASQNSLLDALTPDLIQSSLTYIKKVDEIRANLIGSCALAIGADSKAVDNYVRLQKIQWADFIFNGPIIEKTPLWRLVIGVPYMIISTLLFFLTYPFTYVGSKLSS